MKNYLQVVLLIFTVITMSVLIWAGFSGRKDIFPFLLSLSLFLSISNLLLVNKKSRGNNIYRVAFAISFLSVVLGAAGLIIG